MNKAFTQKICFQRKHDLPRNLVLGELNFQQVITTTHQNLNINYIFITPINIFMKPINIFMKPINIFMKPINIHIDAFSLVNLTENENF